MSDEQTEAWTTAWAMALGLLRGPAGGHVRAYSASANGLRMSYVLLTADMPGLAASANDRLLFHHAGGPVRIHGAGAGAGMSGPSAASNAAMLGPPDRFQVCALAGQTLALDGGSWALISEAAIPEESPDASMSAQRWRPATAGPTGADEGADLVATLGLAPHVEGGYYRELWASRERVNTHAGPRPLASTIYYLLTTEAPLGRFHRNVSDITHLLHRGGPLVYQLISPEGAWQEVVLGRDHGAGQVLAFTCPGGWWKSSQLLPGAPAGLISEIVAPGFDYADHQIADEALFDRLFPQLRARWTGCVRGNTTAAGETK